MQLSELFQAVERVDIDLVSRILADTPEWAHQKLEGATPLHYAALRGHVEMCRVLMRAGADPCARDEEYRATPLGWANEAGQDQTVHALWADGAPVTMREAAGFGLIDEVRLQLKQGGGGFQRLDGWGTPLHAAVLWGREEIAELLFAQGADPAILDVHGRSARQIAQYQKDTVGAATPLLPPERKRKVALKCARMLEWLPA